MKIRVFYPNKENKIEFTKQQLEKLLNEVYEEGRAKGYDQGYAASRPVTITYPYTPILYTTDTIDTTPIITCNNKDNITISSAIMSTENGISIGDEK